MNRAGFWHGGFLPAVPHCVFKEMLVSPKISVLSSGTLSQTPDLGKKFCLSKSLALSAELVVVVDGRVC